MAGWLWLWWILALPLCRAFLDGVPFNSVLDLWRSPTRCVVRTIENIALKTTPSAASNVIACHLAKRDIVADSSSDWPEDAPSWALIGWETPSTSDDIDPPEHSSYRTGNDGLEIFSVTNDSPTWELVLARTFPEDGTSSVSPESAILAPRGGCDNLCDDAERYSDTCEFIVSGDATWLIIRTEDQRWIFQPSLL